MKTTFRAKQPYADIRKLAIEEQVSLVDVYEIWEEARKNGCPWEELLANGINHPGVEGMESYGD